MNKTPIQQQTTEQLVNANQEPIITQPQQEPTTVQQRILANPVVQQVLSNPNAAPKPQNNPVVSQKPQPATTQQQILAKPVVQQLQQEHATTQGQQLQHKYETRKPITKYQDMIGELGYKKPETDEEKAARLKREKRNAIIAAVGDGISALSNLYFANKGAQSSYDPSKGLSAKMLERRDMLRKEREANDREYRAAMLRAKQLDETLADRREAREETRRWRDEQSYQRALANQAKQELEEQKIELARQKQKTADELAAAKIAGKGAYAKTGRRRGSGSGNVTTTEEYDKRGQKVKTKVVTKGNASKTSSAPPSRRTSSSNTPPSRRK